MTRSIDQISFDALTPGLRDNTRSCPACAGVGVLTATDLFCGAGGSSLGLEKVRCTSCGRSLIEVKYALNHWDLAIQAHNTNFPKADHAINGAGEVSPTLFGFTDLGWFSPECFPAGTLITTTRGQVPIEKVAVDDVVLTHLGRWRRVVRTQSKIADTIRVHGQGHTPGIEVTPNHSFWLRDSHRKWENGDRRYQRHFSAAHWAPIGESLDHNAFWATPAPTEDSQTSIALPTPPTVFGSDPHNAWWLIGRWVADGSLTFGSGRTTVSICCSFAEEDELAARIAITGAAWRRRRLRTASLFEIPDERARDFLHANFGHGSLEKGVPGWALQLPRPARSALLDGYVSGDGHVGSQRTRIDSVSHKLAVSVRLLSESLGNRCALYRYEQHSDTIEGRHIRTNPLWAVTWETSGSSTRYSYQPDGDHLAWTRIKSISPGRHAVRVFNIEVDEDHSYVAEGIVVKNCTNYSSAKGAKDNSEQALRSRATFNDIIRFVGHWKYSAVFVENVVEARLWCDEPGHSGQCRCGKTFDAWYRQMLNLGYDGEVVYFNSQFAYPTPQSRDRMYVVFWRRGLARPNVDFTPPAWCSHCETVVPGVQTWKKASKGSVRALDGLFKWGRYGTQYTYNCPTCALPVAPAVTGAKTIIDWSLPATKIGDRSRPLAPNTMRRIRKGLEYISRNRPATVQVGGNLYERDGYARVWAVDGPLKTLTATNELALVTPAGSLEANARHAGRPMHALTGSDRLALTFRAGGQAVAPASLAEPITTITAHDRQRAVLVQAGGTTGSGRNPRGVDEPLGTLTGENHRAVVVPNMANNTGRVVEEPVPVVTGGNRHMLVQVTHGGDRRIRALQEPAPTIAGHGELGIVSMRNHGLTSAGAEPVSTLTAGGYHHAAVMYNGSPGFVRDASDTTGTVTCRNAQSLLVPYYTNGTATSTAEPTATISTKDREALVITDEDIDACQFRMLTWPELLRAQVMHELPDGSPYLLTARQRKANGKMTELSNENRVRMIGNAVSAPVATMLGYAVVDILAGDSLSLAA